MLDVLIFAGDVTDKLLNLPQDEVEIIDDIFLYFLRLCKKYDILFLILEGTPSHDMRQSKRFEILDKMHNVGCNFHYVDDLEIRYFHEIDKHILFVPDEWDKADRTLEAVHELLRQHNLTSVDFAIMHGQFEYQLPEFIPAQKHSSKEYEAIVDIAIFIGHIHQFSHRGKIIAHGSFDRLSHSDEIPKGHVRLVVRSKDDWECVFHENKGAMIYKTIDCKGLSLEESLKKVEDGIFGLRDGSYVRISAETDHPVLQSIGHYEKKYDTLAWDAHERVAKELVKAEKKDTKLQESVFIPVQITSTNISRLALEKMKVISDDQAVIDKACEKLLELI